MNNQKCLNCNCVNWISATQCVRCRQSLSNLPINNKSADNEYYTNSNYSSYTDFSDKDVSTGTKIGLSVFKIAGILLVIFTGFYIVGNYFVYDSISKVTMFQQTYYGVRPPSEEEIKKRIIDNLPIIAAKKESVTIKPTPTDYNSYVQYNNGKAKFIPNGKSMLENEISMSELRVPTQAILEVTPQINSKITNFEILSAKIESKDSLKGLANDPNFEDLAKQYRENPNKKFYLYIADYSCSFSISGNTSTQNGTISMVMK